MDCLDRTNVVESILSREVLQVAVSWCMSVWVVYDYSSTLWSVTICIGFCGSPQLQKLGVIPFDEKLAGATLVSYQEMWANNGDIISKQYAGTAAMKVSCEATPLLKPRPWLLGWLQGDITRYGERKLTGMMKDGYNSAHRYYLNIFRDSYRQVLIGKHVHFISSSCDLCVTFRSDARD